jgi:hypothetical protein
VIARVLAVAAPLLLAGGCLDPLVSDTPIPGDTLLPPGTVLPSIDDDPALAAELDEHDGVDGLIPRVSAFADGVQVHVWEVGPAPAFVAPVYRLVRRTTEGLTGVPHNTLVDTLPGDPGYSPYWAVFDVVVTDRYRGEVIPSVAAIDEAVVRGLVEQPVPGGFAVDCPAVASGVLLEVGGGQPPMPPPRRFNVKGHSVAYFDFGVMAVEDAVRVGEVRHYVLRREGGEPLSEPVRNIDLTGDGDVRDSNDVYDRAADEATPAPRCRTVTVAVPTATASIDTSRDEAIADLTRADQLFAPGPVAGTVLAFTVTEEITHCVVQRAEGGL